MGDAFFNCNGSSAFYTREAVGPINLVIWNIEPLMRFYVCLWEQSHIYTLVLQLFTELIALPHTAICSECYDFEGPMNSSGHFVSLSSVQF
jgi:hypothetical protein